VKKIKLKPDVDEHTKKVLESAKRTAAEVAKWPAWKRGEYPALDEANARAGKLVEDALTCPSCKHAWSAHNEYGCGVKVGSASCDDAYCDCCAKPPKIVEEERKERRKAARRLARLLWRLPKFKGDGTCSFDQLPAWLQNRHVDIAEKMIEHAPDIATFTAKDAK